MKRSQMRSPALGQISIKILSFPQFPQVFVAGRCNDPAINALVDEILKLIRRRFPDAPIIRGDTSIKKRGGPSGTPENEKIQVIKDWLQLQGQMNQEVFSQNHGISSATLRRWMRDLREKL